MVTRWVGVTSYGHEDALSQLVPGDLVEVDQTLLHESRHRRRFAVPRERLDQRSGVGDVASLVGQQGVENADQSMMPLRSAVTDQHPPLVHVVDQRSDLRDVHMDEIVEPY